MNRISGAAMEQEKNRRWMTTPPQRPKWAIVHSLSWPCWASAVQDESAKLIFSRIINDIKIKASTGRRTDRQKKILVNKIIVW